MKSKLGNLPLGLVLVALGALFMAQNLGWLDNFGPLTWAYVFWGAALLFLAGYLLEGVRAWGWLFPTTIFAAIGVTLWMAEQNIDDPWVGAPVLLGVALPFLVAYLVDRKENWWALIPAWVMLVITGILFLVDRVAGEVIGAVVVGGVGLPFILVYLLDRRKTWALIPGFIMLAVAMIPLLAMGAEGNVIAAYILLACALPFFVAFVWSVRNWWALIPAGILSSIALMVLLTGADSVTSKGSFVVGVMFLGFAATFGALWLRRKVSPTDWAKYPAFPLALIGVSFLVFTEGVEYLGAILLILGGGFLLLRGTREEK